MYKEAISDCNEALRLDSANIKAFYRRAQANKELKVSLILNKLKVIVFAKFGGLFYDGNLFTNCFS